MAKWQWQIVLEHLRSVGDVARVALWGRSMGAVTSLMHGVCV